MFEQLKGKRILNILVAELNQDEVHIILDNNERVSLWHEPDCCESVLVASITGIDPQYYGETILHAEVVYASEPDIPGLPESGPGEWDTDDSYTWSFFKIQTQHLDIVITFYGQSNGYYSECAAIWCSWDQDQDWHMPPKVDNSNWIAENVAQTIDSFNEISQSENIRSYVRARIHEWDN